MITFLFPFILLFLIYIFFIILTKKYMKFSVIQLIFITAFYLYIITILVFQLFPLPVQKELIEDSIKYGFEYQNNFIPFTTIRIAFKNYFEFGLNSIIDIIFQIIIYIPFGLYFPILFSEKIKIISIIKYGFSFSIGIKIIQYLINLILGFNYRSINIDEVILTIIGIVIGYFIYIICEKIIKKMEMEIQYIRPF